MNRSDNCYICGLVIPKASLAQTIELDGKDREAHPRCVNKREKALKDLAR